MDIFGAEDIQVENKQEKENHHHKLATKIIGEMRLSDTDKSAKLIAATVTYLDTLEKILKARAATLQQLDRAYTAESAEKTALIVDAYEVARDAFLPLKRKYVAQLTDGLTPYQVDRVKDGLTHDAFPNFEAMYFEMVPTLKPAERAHILCLLVEGRENAMTATDDEGQKQWWDKYRGIINNFIASQGYDFGKLSKAWDQANPDKEWAH
ncbi:MAG TPA: DUF3826 domain-containing protein [Sphingobacterium sp.]|nr:DUF3826 domain-containing protein [Sphingobacterium sp.]